MNIRKASLIAAFLILFIVVGVVFWLNAKPEMAHTQPGMGEDFKQSSDQLIQTIETVTPQVPGEESLPPVPGAGDIEKRTELDLTQADAAEIVDEPSREVSRYFLKAYYNFKTLDTDPNRVVLDFGKYSTKEFQTLAINLPEVRNFGHDQRKWEVQEITFDNAQYSASDLTHWEADVTVTLQEHEGVDVRVVRGRISTEPRSYPHHTGWFVSNWQGIQ